MAVSHVPVRKLFVTSALAVSAAVSAFSIWINPNGWHLFWFFGPLILIGIVDMTQSRHAILRNFPVLGHARYLLELIRPEINQYFIESNTDGSPFNREQRSLVYQRAKKQLDTLPFGTQRDVYATGYEWVDHSMAPLGHAAEPPRVRIGFGRCDQPYEAALLNVSAMSFGSLAPNAVKALNLAAKAGGFAHNTGEGSISAHHRQGGDLIWQLGTGYFGACSQAGVFDEAPFKERAADAQVKMIELKLSQGAKPGHGGILPAAKLTPEIAAIRGVPLGEDVLSPPGHSTFSTPRELVAFVDRLRELSGGKPVGIKFCLGRRHELMAICKAMIELDGGPDYVAVDGGEGGTGAAPLEFSNRIGSPLDEGLIFVRDCIDGFALDDRVKIFASGKVVSGFDMLRLLALGADACYSARAMMLALGCIQARLCNSNACPVGVATQDPNLTPGLVTADKAPRVARYQRTTVHACMEMLAASGLAHPDALTRGHLKVRISETSVLSYNQIFPRLERGQLREGRPPERYARLLAVSDPDSWQRTDMSRSS